MAPASLTYTFRLFSLNNIHFLAFFPAHTRDTWCEFSLDLMVGKIGFSYEPIQAFPTRQGCTPESYELVATFISV